MHPRLLTTLVLLDPVIQLSWGADDSVVGSRASLAVASTFRRDLWPSRRAAADSFAKSPYYQAWDPRVFRLWLQYALRDLPTPLYPDLPAGGPVDGPVTLTTPKQQEVWTFVRPNYTGKDAAGRYVVDRRRAPDSDPSSGQFPFYRPEPISTFFKLPSLRPSVLYVLGGLSNLVPPGRHRDRTLNTGTGVGGSGGIAEGRVRDVTPAGGGHLVPMEAPGESAEESARWLGAEMERWRREEEEWARERAGTVGPGDTRSPA
jgi:hypothetical protein